MKRKTGFSSFAAAVLLVLGAAAGSGAFPGSGGSELPAGGDGSQSVSVQVFDYVEKFYIEPDRAAPLELVEGALSRLETLYPEILATVGGEGAGEIAFRVNRDETTFPIPGEGSLREVAEFIDGAVAFAGDRLAPAVDRESLRADALRGALSALDPHTQFIEPRGVSGYMTRTRGAFGGVGFTIGVADGSVTVLKVFPDTPAARIGLSAGDSLLFVDGHSTEGWSLEETVEKVRGTPGTEVTLTVGRPAWEEPRELTALREIIRMPSVRSAIVGEGGASFLHLQVSRFQEETDIEIREALNSAGGGTFGGVILDLRDNPGGLLDQAVKVADIFLDDGVIVSTRQRKGISDVRRASMFGIVREQEPLIVLINGRSASAAEVVSAALQERRALVIGQTSFGKGSVQQFYPLSNGGGLLLTVAHYLTPGEVSIQSTGVDPDIVVSPVVVGEKNRVTPLKAHYREASLENSFGERSGGGGREGSVVIEHFEERIPSTPPPGTPGHGGMAGVPLPPSPAGEEDFSVRLAARLLAAAAGSEGRASRRREGLLALSGPVLEESAARERSKIQEAFSVQDISWSPPSGGGEEGILEVDAPGDVSLEAGKKSSITLSVRNTGSDPLYRVWGRSESANPRLSNLDFAIGTLAPGESRTSTVEVLTPPGSDERWDAYEVHFRSAAREGAKVTGKAHTDADSFPDIAYSFFLDDENGTEPDRSGDGTLTGGELARLRVVMRNPGDGEIPPVEIRFSPDPKGSLTLGGKSKVIGPLSGGTAGEAVFEFRVGEEAAAEKMNLALQFSTTGHGTLLSDRILLPLGAPYPNSGKRAPPRLSTGPVDGWTDRASITVDVTAEDDEGVKDLYAYRGGKKIYYLRNGGASGNFGATVEVPLDAGLNRIVLFARDRNDTVAKKTLYVYRSTPG